MVVVSFLKKIKVAASEYSVKVLLHKHLRGFDQHRGFDRVHASEVTKGMGICPRTYALYDIIQKAPDGGRWLSTSEQVTFQIGRDLQDAVANWFADMGRAVGNWQCRACANITEFQKRPLKCKCGCKRFDYKEFRVVSKKSGVSGGIDLFLNLDEPLLVPIEIKTIAPDDFGKLLAPLAEHSLRTNLYCRLIAESDDPRLEDVDKTRGIVFYVSKGGYGKADPLLKAAGVNEQFSPFKEFIVKRDDKVTEPFVKPALALYKYRTKKAGMPCGVCSTALDKRASDCAYKQPCWSGDYPAEQEWK